MSTLQQVFAFIIILFFLVQLWQQKRKGAIQRPEFVLWLVFWLMALAVILNLSALDTFVARLGFSSSGINVLLYFAVIVLFYILFKLRLKIEKMDSNITKLTRALALKNENNSKDIESEE